MSNQPYTPQKIRTSLIGAIVLSGVFTLDMLFGIWPASGLGDLLGGTWALVTIIGSPIGAYRGCIGLKFGKGATIGLTLFSFIPPIGLIVHCILLSRLPKS